MELYFSHSYRDVAINTYFFDLFKRINAEGGPASSGDVLQLYADRKSDTWCVAKLERYLFQMAGFVSVIPRRLSDGKRAGFSEYIAYELTLARRSRTPRLLFVDDQVLRDHKTSFPTDAVPFFHDVPQSDGGLHAAAIRKFKRALAGGEAHQGRVFRPRHATVIAPEEELTLRAAAEVTDLLRSESFDVTLLRDVRPADAFENIELLETLLESELCVFLLGEQLSYVNVILAMAHAQGIPSIRFQYDPNADEKGPKLDGVMGWKSAAGLLQQFNVQLQSFRRGFVLPFELAPDSSAAAERLARTDWQPTGKNVWSPRERRALVAHVRPNEPFVVDRVSAVSREIGGFASGVGNAVSRDASRRRDDEVRRRHYYYELEPVLPLVGEQQIRTPNDIDTHRCGTCLDLACLFASLLEAAHQRAVIAIVGNNHMSHALAGYLPQQAVWWEQDPQLGDVRAALHRGDAVLFEATGAVESDKHVGDETDEDRRLGARMLDFTVSEEAAMRTLFRSDVALTHIVDVSALRRLA